MWLSVVRHHYRLIKKWFFIGILLFFTGVIFSLSHAADSSEETQKQYQLYKQNLKKLISDNPSNDKAHFLLGVLYMNQYEYSEAELSFQNALRYHHKEDYEIALGHSLIKQFKANAVLQNISPKGLTDEKTVERLSLHTKAYILTEDYTNAINNIDKILELDPNNIQAYKDKIEIYTLKKEYHFAAELLNTINPEIRHTPDFILLSGNLYIENKNYEKAIKVFDLLIDGNKHLFPSYIGRTKAYLGLKNYAIALSNAAKVTQLYPYSPEGYSLFAQIFIQQKDYEKILEIYGSLSESNPITETQDALLSQGVAYYHLGQNNKAAYFLDKFLVYDQYHEQALELSARTKIKKRLFTQAQKRLHKIIHNNPKNIKAYTLLLISAIHEKRYYDARLKAEKILSLFPYHEDNKTARLFLRFFCDSVHKTIECKNQEDINASQKVLEALLFYEDNQLGNAIKFLQEYLKKMPGNINLLSGYAYVLKEANQFKRAYEIYNQILDRFPNNQEALDNLVLMANNKDWSNLILNKLKAHYNQKPSSSVGIALSKVAVSLGQSDYSTPFLQKLLRQYKKNPRLYSTIINRLIAEKKQDLIPLFFNKALENKIPLKQVNRIYWGTSHEMSLSIRGKVIDSYLAHFSSHDIDEQIRYQRGKDFIINKEYSKAVTFFEKMLYDYPNEIYFYSDLIAAYLANNQTKKAKKLTNTITQNIYLKTKLYAEIYIYEGKYKKALEALHKGYEESEDRKILKEIEKVKKLYLHQLTR